MFLFFPLRACSAAARYTEVDFDDDFAAAVDDDVAAAAAAEAKRIEEEEAAREARVNGDARVAGRDACAAGSCDWSRLYN